MFKKMLVVVLAAVLAVSSSAIGTASIREVRKEAMETYTYKITDDVEIKVDVYPQPKDGKANPVIMWIHGGALIMGTRSPMYFEKLWDTLWEKGYIITTFDYRLSPETRLPEMVEDLRDGYKWLREKGLGLLEADGERVVVAGASAGAYLTLVSGYHFQPRPKALVSFYGYGDLTADWHAKPDPHCLSIHPIVTKEEAFKGVGVKETTGHDLAKKARREFYFYCRQNGFLSEAAMGVDPNKEPEKFKPYCPVKNVTPEYPPTFLTHGTADTAVPFSQSQDMANELAKAGVYYELVAISDGEHDFITTDEKELDNLYEKITAFLEAKVK